MLQSRRLVGAGTFIAVTTVYAALMAPWTASADSGNHTWLTARSAGGASFDVGRAIAVTGDGRPVVAGNFWGTANFPRSAAPDDSITLSSQGFNSAAFFAGLDADAEYFTWALRIVGSAFEVLPTALATTGSTTPSPSDDTVLVTGYFQGTAYFPTGAGPDDSVALTSLGTADGFIASVVPDGSRFGWVRQLGPSATGFGQTQPRALTVDSAGGATVFGDFSTSQALELPTAGAPISVPGRGTNTLFVGRFAADTGYFTWAQGNSGTPTIYVTGGAQATSGTSTPADDRPIVTGLVNPGTIYFPTGRPAPDDSIAFTSSGSDYVVAAMNADDSYFAWVQRVQGPTGGVLAGKPDGGIVLAGGYVGTAYFPSGHGDDSIAITSTALTDAYVAEMNVDDSYFRSVVSAGGSGNDQVRSVAVTSDGEVIVTGDFTQSMSFPTSSGPISVTNTGGSGSFVSQVATTGQVFDWALFATGATNSDSSRPLGVAAAPDGRALMTGQFEGTISFPSASGPLSLTSRGSRDVMVASVGAPAAPAPSPAPASPASAPRDVVGAARDASAGLSWLAPSSSGSFPVSHYLAISTPGAHTCLVTAPALSCEVTGLSNGTAYTFTVKALTGAGWSAASSPSNVVVPRADAKPTIVISGAREGKRIVVTGRATGLDAGSILTPHVARSLEAFRAGSPFLLGADGSITWSRRASASVVWRVFVDSGYARSNTVTIR